MKTEHKKNIQLIIVAILILALPILIFLVGQKQIFKPQAAVKQIEFFGTNIFSEPGGKVGFTKTGTLATIGIRLSSPLGPAAGSAEVIQSPKLADSSFNLWKALVPDVLAITTIYGSCSGPQTAIVGHSTSWSASANGGITSGTGFGVYTYKWNFGGGLVSGSSPETHTFTSAGTFSVSAEASQGSNSSTFFCGSITVTAPYSQSAYPPAYSQSAYHTYSQSAYYNQSTYHTGYSQSAYHYSQSTYNSYSQSSYNSYSQSSYTIGNTAPTNYRLTNVAGPDVCNDNAFGGSNGVAYTPNGISWDLLSGSPASGTRKTVCAQLKVGGNWLTAFSGQIDLNTTGSSPSPSASGTVNSSSSPHASSSSSTGSGATPTPRPTPTPLRTTTDYRVGENVADVQSAAWSSYNQSPTEISHTFSDSSFGSKQICTQFRGSDGTISDPSCEFADLVDPPVIQGCNLRFSGADVNFEISGKNFGNENGVVKVEPNSLNIVSWSDQKVVAKYTNPPTGQSFPISLRNSLGLITTGSCSAVSQLSVSAKLFCPQLKPADIPGVVLELKNLDEPAAPPIKQTITLTKDGLVNGLNTKITEGAKYRLLLRVPKGTGRGVDFTAMPGTTNVEFSGSSTNQLPLGDIFPLGLGDGTINSLDKSELNREWVTSVSANGNRAADLNGDGRVNSFDWACMKADFGAKNDNL